MTGERSADGILANADPSMALTATLAAGQARCPIPPPPQTSDTSAILAATLRDILGCKSAAEAVAMAAEGLYQAGLFQHHEGDAA